MSARLVQETMAMDQQLRCFHWGWGAIRISYIGAAARQGSVQGLDQRERGHEKQ